MKKTIIALVLFISLAYVLIAYITINQSEPISKTYTGERISLPPPKPTSDTSIEEALLKRRSVRDYKDEPLTLADVSQLLWAAQGITKKGLFSGRTAPSAGATYPLELYLIAGRVEGLAPRAYHYNPHGHSLIKILEVDLRKNLSNAAGDQTWIKEAPIVLVFTAFYERTTGKYGKTGIKYVHMEAGHAAQNVYLQAVAMNLGTTVVGGFDDNRVRGLLNLSEDETPLYIMPVGRV